MALCGRLVALANVASVLVLRDDVKEADMQRPTAASRPSATDASRPRFGASRLPLVLIALVFLVAACSGGTVATASADPASRTTAPDGLAALNVPAQVEAGAEFEVAWTGPDGERDFVTIVSSGAEAWTNEPYFYTSAGPSGKLVAPTADGPYEIVYFTGSDREGLARASITVTPFVGSLDAPDEVEAATEFAVAWAGPDGPRDYVSILPAGAAEWTDESYFYTSAGSPGTLQAPVKAGDYELWYIVGGERALMVSRPITVTAGKASVDGPAQAVAGTAFSAEWTGPDGPGDYIAILPAGATEWTNEPYFYTSVGPSGELRAPLADGPHEVVYITGRDRVILARTPIAVTPLEITLEAPATVARGAEILVSWTGPDGPGDYISVLPAGATEWTNEPYFYTGAGSPGTLTAPAAPGTYEIWYIYGNPRMLLESINITVK